MNCPQVCTLVFSPDLDLNVVQFLRGLVLLPIGFLGLLHTTIALAERKKIKMLPRIHLLVGWTFIILRLKLLSAPKTSLLSTKGQILGAGVVGMGVGVLGRYCCSWLREDFRDTMLGFLVEALVVWT